MRAPLDGDAVRQDGAELPHNGRALVVGGTGFIGLAIVDALLHRGMTVRVSRRKRSITVYVRKRPVELVAASLGDRQSLIEAMAGCDLVFISGGHYPRYSVDREATIATGVAGIRSACDAAIDAGVKRLVYTSSIAALADHPQGRAADEGDLGTQIPQDSIYRATKWAMEQEIDRAAGRGLDVVSVLPGGCLGPGDYRLGTGGILVGAIAGLLPFGLDGLVHVIDVADVADAHVRAATIAAAERRYCLPGHTLSYRDLLQLVVGRYGGEVPSRWLSTAAAQEAASAAEEAAMTRRERVVMPRELVDVISAGQPICSALAHRDLGAEYVPLRDALDRSYEWFTRYGYLPATSTPPVDGPAAQRRKHDGQCNEQA